MAAEPHVKRLQGTMRSAAMLRAVVEGATYEAVAAESGVTRTAVERRVKAFAQQLSARVGIEGLSAGASAFVHRLRSRREAVLAALDALNAHDAPASPAPRAHRVVTDEELLLGAQRIRGRSSRPWHDQALFLLPFATGVRPLEIARLEVRDYLNPDGTVRIASELRAEAANSGKARPLYFASARLNAALDAYLAERLRLGLRLGEAALYRGLDPRSPLFLSASGQGFEIRVQTEGGRRHYLCRPILETYRKLFRYAELEGVTPLSVRQTLVARLYERRADEEQVGLLLGIGGRVREIFPRPRPAVAELVRELI